MSRSRFVIAMVAVAIALMGITTSTSAHAPEPARMGNQIVSDVDLKAALPAASQTQLEDLGRVVASQYAKCDFPFWYGEELSIRSLLAGGHAGSDKWIIKRCNIYYEQAQRACIVVHKDEVLYSMDHMKRTFEVGTKFCGYQFVIRRLTSKSGYYSLGHVRTIKFNQIPEYFGGNQGTWSFNTLKGISCYQGPYQLFVVPGGGWIVNAYGVKWSKNNVVGARNFCVSPSLTLFGFVVFQF